MLYFLEERNRLVIRAKATEGRRFGVVGPRFDLFGSFLDGI